MTEAFLSYLWKYRHLRQEATTEAGDQLLILNPGDQNSDSGPDFFNARLRIGDTIWAGNVELHVHASEWYKHGHHLDPSYNQVILHVVHDADRQVLHSNGQPIQTLVIEHLFPAGMYDRYQQMMQNHQWIPCMNQLQPPIAEIFRTWAPALALERLEYRTVNIRLLLNSCGHDWDEAFYRHLAGSFGFKINNLPFELLVKSLPLNRVRKHCGSVFQLEALLYGQAGMLEPDFADSYPRELKREYLFLRQKYNLSPIEGRLWRLLRLRPSNFPAIRISQFAAFLHHTGARFFALFEDGSFRNLSGMLKLTASEYWNEHYLFDKPAVSIPKTMGESGVRLLVINGLAPFLFFYGLEKDHPPTCVNVLNVLENLSGEKNEPVDHWKELGFPAGNAMQTQALLQLKQQYCDRKRCLDCRVGSELLGR